MSSAADTLNEQMRFLTPEQLAKVEALLASLQAEEHKRAALSLSESAFAAVWSDPANDVYDAL